MRTELRVENPRSLIKTTITVEYREDEKLRMWLPSVMKEHYESWRGTQREAIQGEASYRNFRRFQVAAESTIDGPVSQPARPPK